MKPSISITPRVIGGTFTISQYGLTSPPLAWNISNNDLYKAQRALWRKRQWLDRLAMHKEKK